MKTSNTMIKMAEVVRCNMTRSVRLANSVSNSGNVALAEQIIKQANQVVEDMACNLNFLIPGFKRFKFLEMCTLGVLTEKSKKAVDDKIRKAASTCKTPRGYEEISLDTLRSITRHWDQHQAAARL